MTETDLRTPLRPRVPADIADIITDARSYGDDRLDEAFRWLREHEPLGIVETDKFAPFWVVTKHEDVRAVATRPDIFVSGARNITLQDREEEQRIGELLHGRPAPTRLLISMDAPDHPLYRAITETVFRARQLNTLEDDIRAIARLFIDRMAATNGECDFAHTVAFLYPLRVVFSMIGVPEADEALLLRLTQQMVGGRDPDQARGGKALEGAEAAEDFVNVVEDIFSYFDVMSADRRQNPRDDLATLLATATLDGTPLPRVEAMSYYLILASAGHDTTSAATAGAMAALARDPEMLDWLKANPERIKSFVEEATRWISPAKLSMRMAVEDFELRGRMIRKGDSLGLAWSSANRDEEVFDDPFTFKADRRPNKLLAYGNGPHVCLGQHLARLEMRILFEELLPRLEAVTLTGPVTTVNSFQISGPKSVPIRFRMRA